MPIEIDADFAHDIMSQACAIESLPDAEENGERGGPSERWTEVLSDVPCLILPGASTQVERGERLMNVTRTTVYFDAPVELGPTRRVRYDDPARGPRYIYCTSANNVAELSVVWQADGEEFS